MHFYPVRLSATYALSKELHVNIHVIMFNENAIRKEQRPLYCTDAVFDGS